MIERIFTLDKAEIEVTFQWDSGDMSVGINAGWGEDTGVLIKAGPVWTGIIFEVMIDKPVAEWLIEDVQTNYVTWEEPTTRTLPNGRTMEVKGRNKFTELAWDTNPKERALGAFPVICEAVQATWEQVQDMEALEMAGEEGLSLSLEADELDWILNSGEQAYTVEEKTKMEKRLAEIEVEVEQHKAKIKEMQAAYTEKYKDADTK